MKDYEQGEGKILVLDDTVYTGRSINEVKEILKKNNNKKTYPCDICSKMFINPIAVRDHMKMCKSTEANKKKTLKKSKSLRQQVTENDKDIERLHWFDILQYCYIHIQS